MVGYEITRGTYKDKGRNLSKDLKLMELGWGWDKADITISSRGNTRQTTDRWWADTWMATVSQDAEEMQDV